MRAQRFHIHEFPNGITLLGEEMDEVSSAAVSMLVPAGAARDPEGMDGSAGVLMEMLEKGAGSYGSRELSEEFEKIGVHRHASAGVEVSVVSASMIAEHLPRALELFSMMLLQAHLPEAELENVRSIALQEISALEDEPSSKVMHELAKRFYPHPFGRSQLGNEAGVKAISAESLRQFYENTFLAERLIIGVAGKFRWSEIVKVVERAFDPWRGGRPPLSVPELAKTGSVHHIQQDTHQVQLALAYPSVSFGDEDYYVSRVATGVLSGGMAGRLFIEVREKRGLVYRVGASHSAARGRGAMFAYAGTTPENSEECLNVIVTELRKLADGVTDEELARAKVDLKAALIMQSELSSIRSSALVNDSWNLGRIRTLEEIRNGIEEVSNEAIVRHLAAYPVSPITLVTLGPKQLELPK